MQSHSILPEPADRCHFTPLHAYQCCTCSALTYCKPLTRSSCKGDGLRNKVFISGTISEVHRSCGICLAAVSAIAGKVFSGGVEVAWSCATSSPDYTVLRCSRCFEQ